MNQPKIVLPSEQFLLATELYDTFGRSQECRIIGVRLYCVLLWVCLTKSPAPMNGYKWWLVINGTISVLFETYFTLIMPIVLLPYPMLLLDGLVGRNFTFSDFALELYCELLLFFVALIAFVTMTVFLFRYCQTTDNMMYKVVFSSRKISILLFTVVILLLGLMAFIPCHLLVMPPQMLLADIYETEPIIYDQVKNRNIVGMTSGSSNFGQTYFAILYIFTIALIASSVMTFSLTGSYRFMRLNKSKFSLKTKALYLALLHSLTLDVITMTILVVCPILSIVLTTFTSPYTSLATVIGIRIVGLYQILVNVVLFYVVKPYRNAIAQKFGQMFLFIRNISTNLR